MTNPIEQTETRRRAQEAKEYLIAQVVEEAQRENITLSEVERKMLHFTELYETIPDIQEVREQFDREYDQRGAKQKSPDCRKQLDYVLKQNPRMAHSDGSRRKKNCEMKITIWW